MRLETLHDLQRRFPAYDESLASESLSPAEISTLISQARALALSEDFDQAKAALDKARTLAESLPAPEQVAVEVRCDLEEGRQLLLSHRPAKATLCFLRALERAGDATARFFSVEAAILIAMAQPRKNRAQWLHHAVQLTKQSEDGRGAGHNHDSDLQRILRLSKGR